MAYRINKTGEKVDELLEMVDKKTIYSTATQQSDGLMSRYDKATLDEVSDAAPLTNLEIEALLQ